ncbi:MAG TPA: AMP-binding protein, partial [Polyangiaceae bacterium]|nr:AMP-binding protein [Polyangiaceae bacterium]
MITPWLFERIVAWRDAPALVWNDRVANYTELSALADAWQGKFLERKLEAGEVVALEGSFSPNACAALIALVRLGAVIAPLTPLMRAHRDKFLDIAEARLLVEFDEADEYSFHELS